MVVWLTWVLLTRAKAIRRRKFALAGFIAATIVLCLSACLYANLTYQTSVINRFYSLTVHEGWVAAMTFSPGVGTDVPSRLGWKYHFTWKLFRVRCALLPASMGLDSSVIPSTGVTAKTAYVHVDLWPLPLAALGLLAYTHRAVRKFGPAGVNPCTKCGYELAGLSKTDTSTACPECGTKAPTVAPAP